MRAAVHNVNNLHSFSMKIAPPWSHHKKFTRSSFWKVASWIVSFILMNTNPGLFLANELNARDCGVIMAHTWIGPRDITNPDLFLISESPLIYAGLSQLLFILDLSSVYSLFLMIRKWPLSQIICMFYKTSIYPVINLITFITALMCLIMRTPKIH